MKATGYNSKTSWISMVAVAVIAFLIPLPMCILGLIFVIILDNYDVNREEALIPIITYGCLRSVSGPLVGYLGQTFGLRAIILIGCLLASLGIGLSCFTENIVSLTVCLGLIYGTGFSLSFNLITSVIRQHFTKYLSLSSGIYITALSVGSTVMTPVIHYLMNAYGTSGMFLILSGIFLHTVPAALFLKNPKNEERENLKQLPKELFMHNNLKNKQTESVASVLNEGKGNEIVLQVIPTKESENATSEKELVLCEKDEKSYVNEAFQINSESLNLNEPHIQRSNSVISVIPIASKKIQNSGANLNTIELLKYSKIDTNLPNSMVVVDDYNRICLNKSIITHCDPHGLVLKKKNCNALLDSLRLLYNPIFLLHMIIQSGHSFGNTLILTVLVDYARDKEISTEDALYFVTFMPISQIIGSLGFNWITDSACITRANFCAISFAILALITGLLIWTCNFTLLMIGYMVYGCFNGTLFSLFPGMIMDSIEKDQQNMALASRFTLYGLISPLKFPTVAYFRGYLQSYDGLYYAVMGLTIFCGAIAKLIPILESCRWKSVQDIKKEVI